MAAQEYYSSAPHVPHAPLPTSPSPLYQLYPQNSNPILPSQAPHNHSDYKPNGPPYPQDYTPPAPHYPYPQPAQHLNASQYSFQPHRIQVQPPHPPPQYHPVEIGGAPLRPQRSISEPPSPHHRRHSHHVHHRRSDDSRSPSSSRSRSPSHSPTRSHHSHSSRQPVHYRAHSHSHTYPPHEKRKGSSSTPTFLGAFGGSVIGDVIFPGLGTLGGALLGALGGYEVGKKGKGGDGTQHNRDGTQHNRDGMQHNRGRARSGSHRSWWDWDFGGKSYEEEWEEGKRRRGEI